MNQAILGPLCAFCSSITWAIGTTGYSKLSRNQPLFAVNITRALVSLPLFVLTTFFLAGGIEEGVSSFQEVNLTHWGWSALSVISSYSLGDILFLLSTRALGVSTALAIASSYPLWTVLVGSYVSGTTLSLSQWLGVLLTTVGVTTVILGSPQRSTGKLSVKGVALAFSASILWAVNIFAIAQAGYSLSAPVANSIRMVVAILFCAILGSFFVPGQKLFLKREVLKRNAWIFLVEGFVGASFFTYGLSHSPLAVGTILASLAPVLSVPFALLFGLEKFSIVKTVGICAVVGGVWLLLGSL